MDLLRARREGSGSPQFGQLSALCATWVPHSAHETRAIIDPEVEVTHPNISKGQQSTTENGNPNIYFYWLLQIFTLFKTWLCLLCKLAPSAEKFKFYFKYLILLNIFRPTPCGWRSAELMCVNLYNSTPCLIHSVISYGTFAQHADCHCARWHPACNAPVPIYLK